jgi:nitrogen-specific signal transduction histidine kinase
LAGEDLIISVGLDTDPYTQDLATVIKKAKDLVERITKMPAAQVKLEFGTNTKAALLKDFGSFISVLEKRASAKKITLSAVASDVRSTKADDAAAKAAAAAAEAATIKRTAAEQKQQYELAGIRGAADLKQKSAEQKQQYELAGITQAGIDKRLAAERKQQVALAGLEAKKLTDAKTTAKAYAEAQVSQLPKLRYALTM